MNKDENREWSCLRNQATVQFRPDFGRQVVQLAVRQRYRRRQQPKLALMTLLVLLCVVNFAFWWQSHEEEKQRVAQWEQWQSFQQVMLTSL
jgi:hypothetical protein